MRFDRGGGEWGEEDRSVSVRFEVDSDRVRMRGVVEMLHSCRYAGDWNLLPYRRHISSYSAMKRSKTNQDVGEILRRASVRISGLNDSDVQFQTSILDQLNDEPSDQSRDLVSIQQMEDPSFVSIIKDDTIGISVERAVSLERDEGDAGRSSLLRFDVVRSTLRVERAESRDFVFGDVEREDRRSNKVDKGLQLWRSDSIGAIDGDGRE